MTGGADCESAAKIAAVVLAAGFSSRMGAFKPLLPFGERTLIDRVTTNLRAAGLRRIYVVTGFRADDLAPELQRLDVVRAHNPQFAGGMFSSVQAGVAALPTDIDAFLLAPVDIPLLRPSTIARLMDAAAACDSTILYPSFRGERGHPPLVRRRLFAEILAGDVDGGMKALLARHQDESREVAVFDWGCLHDMDCRGDYRLLAAAAAGHRTPDAEECEAMMEATGAPETVRRHGQAVAALAARWSGALLDAGEPIDPNLIRAAALLHDIAKGRPHHAAAGAAIVGAFGFPEIAEIIARHMDLGSGAVRLDERAIVYLADKLVLGEARVSLQTRFAPAFARFAGDAAALAGVKRRLAGARAIAGALEARIGRIEIDDGIAPGAEEIEVSSPPQRAPTIVQFAPRF